jgi:regulatory Fis family protein
MQRHDYIEGFADLVIPHDPEAFRQRLLAGVVARFGARRVALFLVEGERLRLAASSAVDQVALDRARELFEGRVKAGGSKPVVEAPTKSASGAVAIPIAEPAGLLYFETDKPSVADGPELQRLADLSAIALRENTAAPVRTFAAGYLRQASEQDLLRDKLLLALQEHEWNIARVARLLGVTRRTIYLRLERWGIARRKIPKTAKREA